MPGDLVHDRGVGGPQVERVGGAEHGILLFGHGDDFQRLSVEQEHLPHRVAAVREQLFPGVVVDDHVGMVRPYVVPVEEPAFGGLEPLDVEILLAHAAELGVHRDVAVDERARRRGVGRGAVDVALLAEDVGVRDGERLDLVRFTVAEALPGIDVDGVRTHRADVGDDLFLRPAPQRDHGHHRGDADDDAEHGQHGPHLVGEDGLHRHFERLDELILAEQEGGAGRAGEFAFRRGDEFPAPGVGNDRTVLDFDDPAGKARDVVVVGHDDDGVPPPVQLGEDVHDVLAAFGVERAGGFVGKDDAAAVHERPGDGNALLLAAGKLVGLVLQLVRQAQIREQGLGPVKARLFVHPGVYGGKGHVFRGGQRGEQVVALEDEPDALPAQFRELVAVQRADVHAADAADPGRLGVEAAQDVHERRLARARGAGDCDELTGVHRQAHVVQDVGATGLALKDAVHVADVDDGTHYIPSSADMLPESAL